ncbi:TPA: hypothetical protein N0F65_000293 [Lagenidium giganteum]|uniref:Uncharacterized protein n=1 Tax=Lagenidium giganteum TaxID=4803 RepID=A0AAV2Z6T8_9STRA|nr:TPA: hypothetical protein N0F65_000293 [Lagenidium giganteum]
MAKKKKRSSQQASSGNGDTNTATATQATSTSWQEVLEVHVTELRAAGRRWYDKERQGIELLESFDRALRAFRSAGKGSSSTGALDLSQLTGVEVMVTATGGNASALFDPMLLEDVFAQLQTLESDFEALLHDMCASLMVIKNKVSDATQNVVGEPAQPSALCPAQLVPEDYATWADEEVALFEAEFQHVVRACFVVRLSWRRLRTEHAILFVCMRLCLRGTQEALLRLLTFDISLDVLRTLLISWTTSPFLDPQHSKQLEQRRLLLDTPTRP